MAAPEVSRWQPRRFHDSPISETTVGRLELARRLGGATGEDRGHPVGVRWRSHRRHGTGAWPWVYGLTEKVIDQLVGATGGQNGATRKSH